MATVLTVKVTGTEGLLEVINEMKNDFGDKATNRTIIQGAREAMKPALAMAKSLVPVDTGALRASLQIEARKPTKRDKRSKYVNESDVVVAFITTASGKQLAKRKFHNVAESKRQGKKVVSVGIESDGRAVAQEFGTAKIAAKPYLRPALEATAEETVSRLGEAIKNKIQTYRAKNTRG